MLYCSATKPVDREKEDRLAGVKIELMYLYRKRVSLGEEYRGTIR